MWPSNSINAWACVQPAKPFMAHMWTFHCWQNQNLLYSLSIFIQNELEVTGCRLIPISIMAIERFLQVFLRLRRMKFTKELWFDLWYNDISALTHCLATVCSCLWLSLSPQLVMHCNCTLTIVFYLHTCHHMYCRFSRFCTG